MTNFRGLVPSPLMNIPAPLVNVPLGLPPLHHQQREGSSTPSIIDASTSKKDDSVDNLKSTNSFDPFSNLRVDGVTQVAVPPVSVSPRNPLLRKEVTITSPMANMRRTSNSTTDLVRRRSSGFSLSEVEELKIEDEERCSRFYDNLETSQDGTIGVQELVSSCRLIGLQVSERYIVEIFDSVPKNSQWKLTRQEYLNFMRIIKCLVTPEVWKASLDKMDWVGKAILRESDLPRQRLEYINDAIRGGDRRMFFIKQYIWELYYIIAPLYYAAILPLSLITRDTDVHAVRIAWEFLLTAIAFFDAFRNANANDKVVRLIVDVPAVIPLDLLGILLNQQTVFALGYAIRLLAVFKINSILTLKKGGILSATLVRFSTGYLPLFRQIFFVLLTVHLVTCLFITAACLTEGCRAMPSFDEYQTGIYWTLYTISSVGYGDIPVDTKDARALATVCFCLSIVVNGWLVGRVTSYMVLDTEGEKQQMMHRTLQVITHYHLPQDVVEDILTLQHYMLGKKIALKSFTEVVEGFPTVVREQLSLYVRVEHMNQIPLFLSLSPFCKVALAEVLETKILAREEHVIVEGEKGTFMFFVLHGFAQVVKGSKHVATLTKGAMAGEMALMQNESLRSATITTLTLCEILTLEREDFECISEKHPSLRLSIESEVSRRVQGPSATDEGERKKLRRRHTLVGNAIGKHLQRRNLENRGMKIASDEEFPSRLDECRTPRCNDLPAERRLSALSQMDDFASNPSPSSRQKLFDVHLPTPNFGSSPAAVSDINMMQINDKLNLILDNQKWLGRRISEIKKLSDSHRGI